MNNLGRERIRLPGLFFEGTVKRLEASLARGVPVSAKTAIVHVDHLFRAPDAFEYLEGTDVTVELMDRAVRVGQTLQIHAVGWIYSDALALRQVPGPARSSLPTTTDYDHHQAVVDLAYRVDQAPLIVVGTVVQVRPIEIEAGQVSHHHPRWGEAVVRVDEVLKGHYGGANLVIDFPRSADVAWHLAPKPVTGERRVWLPRLDDVHHPGRFVLLEKADVQPTAVLPAIRRAVAIKR